MTVRGHLKRLTASPLSRIVFIALVWATATLADGTVQCLTEEPPLAPPDCAVRNELVAPDLIPLQFCYQCPDRGCNTLDTAFGVQQDFWYYGTTPEGECYECRPPVTVGECCGYNEPPYCTPGVSIP